MVMRYYGNKDKLFAAAAEFDLQFPDFAGTVGSRSAERWFGTFSNVGRATRRW